MTNRSTALDVLQFPEYRSFIVARFFYIMAMRMVTTVIGWRIYELTHNPFAIGLLGLSEFLPAFSLALYAGHAIDISDKRAMLLKTTVSYLLCVVALVILSVKSIVESFSVTHIQWLIYFVIFCTGIIRAFAGPALNAIIAQIVPREKLPGAVTLNSSAWLLASVLGHGTGGFLIAHTGYVNIFLIIAAYVCIALFAIYRITSKPILLGSSDKKTWESSREGLNFVFKTKEVLG
ncbi:MAG: MFS transporter, partial [Chitinophagaceae bacterium]